MFSEVTINCITAEFYTVNRFATQLGDATELNYLTNYGKHSNATAAINQHTLADALHMLGCDAGQPRIIIIRGFNFTNAVGNGGIIHILKWI